MADISVFEDDAFSVHSLTTAINATPEGQAAPDILDNLFSEQGITTTSVLIDREGDSLALVPDTERGAAGDITTGPSRDAIPFITRHLPTHGSILADEIQNVRALGKTEVQAMADVVNARLDKMRRRLEVTLRYHRVGAVTGRILDADGSRVLLDAFQRFGIEQNSQAMALDTGTTDVNQNIRTAKRKSEDVIGDTGMITGWLGICGRGYYDAFVGHAEVKEAFKFWTGQSSILRDDMRKGFEFEGVLWREFYGRIGGIEFIGANDAYLIPLGVDDLFQSHFAPANYMETVNTLGVPFYAKQELKRFGKGVDLEAQSNPLMICTRPRAVIKLTRT